MPNFSGMPPLSIKVTDAILELASSFKPNQPYRGVVQITPKGAQVLAAGVRIPLPKGTPLQAGNTVTVTHQTSAEGSKLLVQPLAPSSTPTVSLSANNPLSILKSLMDTLPILKGISPQQAMALSPAQLPQIESVLRMALQIFEFKATTQEAVKNLSKALEILQASDVQSPGLTKVLELLGAEVKMEDPQSIVRFLKAIQAHSRGMTLPTSGEISLEDSLYALLGKLRNDPSLVAALESRGALTSFQQAVDTLLDHVAGQHVQNARSAEVPYAYLNIPFPEDSGIVQAQIHVLGEGHEENEWNDEGHSQIVLDLQTTRLGELWIHVSHRPEQCLCQFEVSSEAIVAQINEVAEDLKHRLEAQGFQHVTVHATIRSTERMEALARLLQPYSGLDVQA